MKREKILGIPSYADQGRVITEGSVYHVSYYGRNTMGSHANQLNEKDLCPGTKKLKEINKDLCWFILYLASLLLSGMTQQHPQGLV